MREVDLLQLRVESMVRATGSMDQAEDLIDQTPGLSKDERSALWLLGWSLLPSDRAVKEARAHLNAVRKLQALPDVAG